VSHRHCGSRHEYVSAHAAYVHSCASVRPTSTDNTRSAFVTQAFSSSRVSMLQTRLLSNRTAWMATSSDVQSNQQCDGVPCTCVCVCVRVSAVMHRGASKRAHTVAVRLSVPQAVQSADNLPVYSTVLSELSHVSVELQGMHAHSLHARSVNAARAPHATSMA
jgi:hypothetical protein